MPPRTDDHHHESTPLSGSKAPLSSTHMSFGTDNGNNDPPSPTHKKVQQWALVGVSILFAGLYVKERHANHNSSASSSGSSSMVVQKVEHTTVPETNLTDNTTLKARGPYQLLQRQDGEEFFDFYDFYDGEDSEGSAGYNRYVSDERAFQLGLASVTQDDFVYMGSTPTHRGPRESVRLEGRTLFNRGLFIVDVRHMPAGCGVWPAFWLTNEEHWPDYGEVDIIEGINNQTLAKTALHTSQACSMYAHVPEYNRTGVWDRACEYFQLISIVCFAVLIISYIFLTTCSSIIICKIKNHNSPSSF